MPMYNSFCELRKQRSKMQEWRNWQTRRLQVPVVVKTVWVQVPSPAPEGANLNTPKRILHFFEKVVAVVLKFSK